jgi:hypothetical protein
MQFVAQKQVLNKNAASECKKELNFFSFVRNLFNSIDDKQSIDEKYNMAKVLHLSKLSRGHVELSESGSRLEIFADQTVRTFLL